ncbi:MAG: hypothetical protein WA151_20325 [Desulfatirhabdiaceae bacterium]
MKDPLKKFEDLVVWRKAHSVCACCLSLDAPLIEEVSKLLEADMRAILNSDS